MFFEAEVRIKSNTEEFKSSRRRKEGACDMISDFCGFS